MLALVSWEVSPGGEESRGGHASYLHECSHSASSSVYPGTAMLWLVAWALLEFLARTLWKRWGAKKTRAQDASTQTRDALEAPVLYAAPLRGECYHSQKACRGLGSAATLRCLRPCSICCRNMVLLDG